MLTKSPHAVAMLSFREKEKIEKEREGRERAEKLDCCANIAIATLHDLTQ